MPANGYDCRVGRVSGADTLMKNLSFVPNMPMGVLRFVFAMRAVAIRKEEVQWQSLVS